jgi:hypothetical protein
VKALCRRGELELCAAAAKLAGRREAAKLWAAAAEAAAEAVLDTGYEEEMADRLLGGWKRAMQRAEALAERARRAEK